jgi:hypothetical protein
VAGFQFRLKYCNLKAGSWMHQMVLTTEYGHMRTASGQVGRPTYERVLISEIFRVDPEGCTITPDNHRPGNKFAEESSQKEVCPLCDYSIVRRAWQYDNADVQDSGGALNQGMELPRGLEGFGDDENYHLLLLKREGNRCLVDEDEIRLWVHPSIQTESQGTLVGHWKAYFTWAIPCAPEPPWAGPPPPTPPPPPPDPEERKPPITPGDLPLQPPHGSKTGVPTISTSGLDIGDDDATEVRRGPGGWRRGGDLPPWAGGGEGRYPLF